MSLDRSQWRARELRYVAKPTGYHLDRNSRWKGNEQMKNCDRLGGLHQFISRDQRASLRHRKWKHTSLACKRLIWKSQGSTLWMCCIPGMYFALKCENWCSNHEVLWTPKFEHWYTATWSKRCFRKFPYFLAIQCLNMFPSRELGDLHKFQGKTPAKPWGCLRKGRLNF